VGYYGGYKKTEIKIISFYQCQQGVKRQMPATEDDWGLQPRAYRKLCSDARSWAARTAFAKGQEFHTESL
jgi:hypothetical protein